MTHPDDDDGRERIFALMRTMTDALRTDGVEMTDVYGSFRMRDGHDVSIKFCPVSPMVLDLKPRTGSTEPPDDNPDGWRPGRDPWDDDGISLGSILALAAVVALGIVIWIVWL